MGSSHKHSAISPPIFRALFDQSPLAIQILSPDGTTLKVNPAWEDLWGVKLDALANYNILKDQQLIDKGVMPMIEQAFAGEAAFVPAMEYDKAATPQVEADDGKVWVRTHIYPSLNEQGELQEVIIVQEDVSQSKLTEEKALRYQQIFALSNDAIAIIDTDGKYIEQNEAHLLMLGYSWQELEGQTPAIHMGEKRFQEVATALARHGVFHGEVESTANSGEKLAVDLSAFAIKDAEGETLCYVGIKRDITKRKQRTEELRLHHFAIDHSPDAVYWMTPEGKFVYVNETASKTLGYSRDELLSMGVSDIDPSLPNGIPPEMVAATRETGSGRVQTRHQRKDGTLIPVDVMVSFINYNGVDYHCAFVRDISEQEQTESKLQRTSEFLSTLIDNASEGISVCYATESFPFVAFSYWNDRMTQITGYTMEEINERGWYQSMYPDPETQQRAIKRMERMREGDNLIGEEWVITTKSGEKRDLSISTSLVTLPDGSEAVVGLMQDVTRQRLLEENLRHIQRMESIGSFVGGVAHEFNNMLAATIGNTYLAKLHKDLDPDVVLNLERIELISNRAAEMVRHLLTFARKDRVEMETMDLNECILKGCDFAKLSIPEDIHFDFHINHDPMQIRGNCSQLRQVLIALFSNAVDAVAQVKNPEIYLELKPCNKRSGFVHNHPDLNARKYASIAVSDNGYGIAKELLDKVFDPFFTTKEIGKGSGLGLAIVYGAVQSHQGFIEVDSQPGYGTTISVILPLLEEAAEELQEETAISPQKT